MTIQYWDEPVDVTLDGFDHRRTIVATFYACECLLTLWPNRQGPAYEQALKTCAEAVRSGTVDHAMARTAFIEAAREARVLTA
ncbi:MAG: DUF982 domain-containing protein [Rhizobium sp.]|nr:DUF982 domain-containing protein [Rhizobium sp.]